MPYTRTLKYQFPLLSGNDVIEVQMRLRDLGYSQAGQPDGIFGARSEAAVRAFQQDKSLTADGIVGPQTWSNLFADTKAGSADDKIQKSLDALKQLHCYRSDGVSWHLDRKGVLIGDSATPEITGGEPKTVRYVWQCFHPYIEEWSAKFGVPVELIVATICTETGGDQRAERREPGYISDQKTPGRVSIGLMQTLISTARETLRYGDIDREWLLQPGNAIEAGTAYIAKQWRATNFDPPKVACAYNAGGVYLNDNPNNRWRMLQYPINTSHHADRFVQWFNDCFRMFEQDGIKPEVSFFKNLK